ISSNIRISNDHEGQNPKHCEHHVKKNFLLRYKTHCEHGNTRVSISLFFWLVSQVWRRKTQQQEKRQRSGIRTTQKNAKQKWTFQFSFALSGWKADRFSVGKQKRMAVCSLVHVPS